MTDKFKIKTLSMIALLTLNSSVFAATDIQIKQFMENTIKAQSNNMAHLVTFSIEGRKTLPNEGGWEALLISASVQNQDGQTQSFKNLLFTKGALIASELVNVDKNIVYNDTMISELSAKLNDSIYTKERLVIGEANAKHKIVIFSDPLCPYCQQSVPAIITEAGNKKDVAVYLIDFPLLNIHPASATVTEAMRAQVLKKDKTPAQTILSFYRLNIEPTLQDQAEILKQINTQLGVSLTPEDLKKAKDGVKKDAEEVAKLKIDHTPSFFVDGKPDVKGIQLQSLLSQKDNH